MTTDSFETADAQETPGNPVIPTYAADPHVAIVGDRFWMVPTNAGVYPSGEAFHADETGENGHGFAAWSSRDLRSWQSEGTILKLEDISWARDLAQAWAPCLAERNGRFYFYFCAGSRIGVAVGDSLRGPFRDALGHPLVEFRADLSAIDPMVFVDDDGQAYLYWGAVPASWLHGQVEPILAHLSVQKLASDMTTLQGEEISTIFTPAPPHGSGLNGYGPHIEASHVLKRNGVYYLMWSAGNWTGTSDEDAYHVRSARSESPLGPWRVQSESVLVSRRDIERIAPGHHCVVNIPGTDEWWCVYHAHKGENERRVFVDELRFHTDGSIAPVVPTLEGPPRRPLRLGLRLRGFGPFALGQPVEFEILCDEPLARVELFAHAEPVARADGSPQTLRWTNAARGFHQVWARATTDDGDSLTSSAVPFDVQ